MKEKLLFYFDIFWMAMVVLGALGLFASIPIGSVYGINSSQVWRVQDPAFACWVIGMGGCYISKILGRNTHKR